MGVPESPTKKGSLLGTVLRVVLVNAVMFLLLLVPVELVFGNWVRSVTLSDLKRFSIPIDAKFEFDVSELYPWTPGTLITSSRDRWGLRGDYGGDLARVDVLTLGGSTTDQRYIDDSATWQTIMQRRLAELGRPLTVANAGVDGQSTLGHLFNFEFWFPLLTDLHPKVMLTYTGINDVMRHSGRDQFDARVDANQWRFKSATFQLYRTFRDNMRARDTRVWHGRMRHLADDDFTTTGLLNDAQRAEVSGQLTGSFMRNIELLRQHVTQAGSLPVFVTQTAYAWNGDHRPPRGVKETAVIYGLTVNYADVAYLHQAVNRALLAYCDERRVTCFDLASDVVFEEQDYYDYLHNSPAGAAKIGRYLADRLAALDLPAVPR